MPPCASYIMSCITWACKATTVLIHQIHTTSCPSSEQMAPASLNLHSFYSRVNTRVYAAYVFIIPPMCHSRNSRCQHTRRETDAIIVYSLGSTCKAPTSMHTHTCYVNTSSLENLSLCDVTRRGAANRLGGVWTGGLYQLVGWMELRICPSHVWLDPPVCDVTKWSILKWLASTRCHTWWMWSTEK